MSAGHSPSAATETTPNLYAEQLQGQKGNRLAAAMSIRTLTTGDRLIPPMKPLHPVPAEPCVPNEQEKKKDYISLRSVAVFLYKVSR